MLLLLKKIDVSLFLDSHSMKLGIHLSAKYLLKKLAFNLKSGSNLLFINNGGIKGTFLSLQKVFKIDWYVFELVLGSFFFLC